MSFIFWVLWNWLDYHNYYCHYIRIEKKEWKTALEKRVLVNLTKTSLDQFQFFTGNHSHSESFAKNYNISLFFIKNVYFKVRIHTFYCWCLIQEDKRSLKSWGEGGQFWQNLIIEEVGNRNLITEQLHKKILEYYMYGSLFHCSLPCISVITAWLTGNSSKYSI